MRRSGRSDWPKGSLHIARAARLPRGDPADGVSSPAQPSRPRTLRSSAEGFAGVRRQAELREAAPSDGYVEDNLWTGIGHARLGCGAAIVGDPAQVLAKLKAYQALGIEAFILSDYPHSAEADLLSRYALPKLAQTPRMVD